MVSSLTKGGLRGIKRRRKRITLCLLLLLTIAIVSACTGTTPDQNRPSDSPKALTDCRLVQHPLGEACVPLNPQRIVVLGAGIDTALSLGVKPVGSTEVGRKDYDYLTNKVAGVENLGHSGSPNLERITALKPDLILGTMFNRQSYELLSQIAPTVLDELRFGDDWKKLLSKYAEALGKASKAEQILANYHSRIATFQAQMGKRLQQTEVSIVGIHQQDSFFIYLEDSYCGGVVADAGLPRPSVQTKFKETFNAQISDELLHKADGDVIFVWAAHPDERIYEAQTTLEELRADPLWSKLNAVQQDKVYDVPSLWNGVGPIAANLILDDLFKYLVDSPPQAAQ